MKTKLLFILVFITLKVNAQEPIISATNLMLCPNEVATASITNPQNYDNIQWYRKFWFEDTPFEPIENENNLTLSFDQFNYSDMVIKVIVTINGIEYESNTLQIDSYQWTNVSFGYEENENILFDWDTETYSICDGDSMVIYITSTVFTSAVWYKDDVLIEGENGTSLVITDSGVYYAQASTEFCPNNINTSMPLTVTKRECEMSVEIPQHQRTKIYPNPTTSILNFEEIHSNSTYQLYDQLGRNIMFGNLERQIDLSNLTSGIYNLVIKTLSHKEIHKIIKK